MKLIYPYDKIRNYFSSQKEEIGKRLIDLVRIPSVRGTAAVESPFGKSCSDALDAVADIIEKTGVERSYELTEEELADIEIAITHADIVKEQFLDK